jgi:hypothetical protein
MSLKIDASLMERQDSLGQFPNQQIILNIHLPNGNTDELSFRADLTVDYVKLALERKYELPFRQQVFELNGKVMPEILSLCNFPALAKDGKGDVYVRLNENAQDEDEEDD